MGFEQALECLDHVFIFYVYLEITQQMFLREMLKKYKVLWFHKVGVIPTIFIM